VELPAGRYETLLPPSAVSDLLLMLAWSMDGRSAQEGRSAFSGPDGPRVGERLTHRPLTMASDPAAPGLEYAPFVTALRSGEGTSVFDNGAPTRRVDWLRDGAIHELAYSRAEAAEFGTAFAPSGDNLLLTGGSTASLADMVAGTRRGLLLTCLWYIREVDPATLLLTGLTRDGVYLVENGEVVAEVDHNFRFNHSPLDVLRHSTEVGATERTLPREWKDWFTRVAMPPIRVPEFTMSSVSPSR
jgi:predicted Zn-dependent protease